jgi:hypothetical protein
MPVKMLRYGSVTCRSSLHIVLSQSKAGNHERITLHVPKHDLKEIWVKCASQDAHTAIATVAVNRKQPREATAPTAL